MSETPSNQNHPNAMDCKENYRQMAALLRIMAKLRTPGEGCPWDLEQDFASIAPYTIEEAYEVAEAIQNGDLDGLKDELGDLLLQVVFHARMAEEQNAFDFAEVVAGICDKMIRRHPHVFAQDNIDGAAEQTKAWEDHKAAERQAKAQKAAAQNGGVAPAPSVLDGVATALPGLTRAVKLQRRAARVGFDWPSIAPVFAKLAEETEEIKAEVTDAPNPERLLDEVGDLLFVAANLARHLNVDPEAALRYSNAKFERRFRAVEAHFDHQMHSVTLADMDAVWNQVKKQEG